MPIVIDTNQVLRTQKNFWNAIHFHPTDAIEDAWGQRILNRVAEEKVAHTVRMYAMLEDIVTRDAEGRLCYDFTENDVRMDYMVQKGFQLLVSYNFIPPCIAENPGDRSSCSKGATRYKGKMIVTSRPKDYEEWSAICYEYTKHLLARYGHARVSKWYLQCFNEPDVAAFFLQEMGYNDAAYSARLSEYCNLYAAFQKGVLRADTTLKIGGPASGTTDFFEAFLREAQKRGFRLDFVCGHSYGTSPASLNNGTKPIAVENNVAKIRQYRDAAKQYYPNAPLIIDEWGASCNGFFNKEECPALMFREHEAYSAFFARLIAQASEQVPELETLMICLSGQHEMTEDFSGFRNFFTLNFFAKPIYHAYALASHLGEKILSVSGTTETLSAIATQTAQKSVAVLISNATAHFEGTREPLQEQIIFSGLNGEKRVSVWKIDRTHTNPYRLWAEKGWGKELTAEQVACLRAEGTLKPETYTVSADGTLTVPLTVSDNGVALIEIE